MAASHEFEPDFGTGEKNLSVYVKGILACIVLTLIPFAVVHAGSLTPGATIAVIFSTATAQFLVQVVCFLRLNYTTEQAKMNTLSFIFTLVIMVIVVAGSLWIMYNLNYNMMH